MHEDSNSPSDPTPKKAYASPLLTEHGSLGDITQALVPDCFLKVLLS